MKGKWMRIFLFGVFLLPLLFLFADQASLKATQLIRVGIGIKENHLLIKEMNSTITNRGTEEQKRLYKRCIQHHIESEILYHEMDLGVSYAELVRTQTLLVRLYSLVIKEEIDELKEELVRLARLSSGKEKPETKEFFRLGFRQIAVAKQKWTTGHNTRPYLPSIKLRDYSFALHSLKDGEKYIVLLGLLHDSNGEFENDKKSFQELESEIVRLISSDKQKYIRFLYDSRFLNYGDSDFFKTTWENPNLEELEMALADFDPPYKRRPTTPQTEK